jgi:hypothetical protein
MSGVGRAMGGPDFDQECLRILGLQPSNRACDAGFSRHLAKTATLLDPTGSTRWDPARV